MPWLGCRRDHAAKASSSSTLGGRGVPATASVADLAEALPDELRNAFDLVVLDPRAVGESGYLSCTDPQARTWSKHRSTTPRTTTLSAPRWQHTSRGWATPVANASHRWWDTLAPRSWPETSTFCDRRSACSASTSSGSRTAASWPTSTSRLFPAHVERMVLDGVVVPGESPANAAKASAVAAEDALYNFVLQLPRREVQPRGGRGCGVRHARRAPEVPRSQAGADPRSGRGRRCRRELVHDRERSTRCTAPASPSSSPTPSPGSSSAIRGVPEALG